MRPLKKFVLVVTPFGLTACASIWGFEDAKDRVEGGDAATDAPVSQGEVVPSNVAGVVCAPRPPQGWQGPLAFYTASGSTLPDPPECAAQYEKVYDGKGDLSAPAGECKCECDPSTTTACESPLITLYSDAQCNTVCSAAQKVPTRSATDPNCANMNRGTCPPGDTGTWGKAGEAHPGGACTAKTIGTPPTHTWGSIARLCEPTKDIVADCGASSAPAPETKFPFQPGNYCIATTIADAACPDTYVKKRVFYDPAVYLDTRTCNACTCGAPTGTCGGQVHVADTGSTCTGGEDFLKPLPSPCIEIKKSGTFAYEPGASATNAKCDPGGGGPMGAFQPTAPTTICCRF